MSGNKRILLNCNVYDAALQRINWLFDEFKNVIVGVSGGKDSTVVYELCMKVARERGRLPLKVMFIDQECEWLSTIKTVKEIMYNKDVEPMWFQINFHMHNATTFTSGEASCWHPGAEWIRHKDPIARTESVGTQDWDELFPAIINKEFGKDAQACYIAGVRAEESAVRSSALTSLPTYKGVCWGKKLKNNKFTFYPLYDWSYSDIWKAIHDNQWPYNSLYDTQYQYGIPVHEMRVSNLHHSTAIQSLFILQEVEPQNYNAIVKRIPGIDSAGKAGREDFYCPKELPVMFESWLEYRDYLLENLIDEQYKDRFRAIHEKSDKLLLWIFKDGLRRRQISAILCNDWYGTKVANIAVPKKHWQEFKRRRDELKRTAQSSR